MTESEPVAAVKTSFVQMPLADAYSFLRARLDSDDAEMATREVQRVLAAYSNDLHAHLLAGEALYRLGHSDGAMTHFKRAVDADPEEPAAHVGLGVLAEEAGDMERVAREYLAASRLQPALEGVREQIVSATGERPAYFDEVTLMRLHLASRDGTAALAEWRGMGEEVRSEPWARLGLLQALWLIGRDVEADALARELLVEVPGSLKPALIISFIEARRGNQDAALAALAELREEDPSGKWIANHADSAPPTWRAPDWLATVEIAVPIELAEADNPVFEKLEDVVLNVAEGEYQATDQGVSGLPLGLEPLQDEVVYNVPDYLAELEARYGIIGAHQFPETPEAAAVSETPEAPSDDPNDSNAQLYTVERDLSYYYNDAVNMAPAEEPIQVPITLPAEPDPAVPDSPEAPTFPEPVPDSPKIPESPATQPGIPELPIEPEIDPVAPTPEIQPGYTPTPEITDIPPTTLPEIPQAPSTSPGSPMGWADAKERRYKSDDDPQPAATDWDADAGRSGAFGQSATVMTRAEEMRGAGYYADALDLYTQALRQGEAEVSEVLQRVTAMEPHLTGHAAWHQVRGDLYRRTGLSRRAMREYQLALQARRRSS